MNDPPTQPAAPLFSGTVRVFLAESLIIPTGLLTAAFLSRQLGPDDYGLFTIAIALVLWIEWSITSMLADATYKLVAEARDWRPVAATVVRVHLLLSIGAAGLLVLLSEPLAALFGAPVLAAYFRLLALDIPLFSLAHGHRNVLVGLGRFRERAVMTAARWIFRLILIVALVSLGFSVTGAIVGSIGASLIELIVGRWYARPPIWGRLAFPLRRLLGYALPLFFFGLSLRLFDKLDLFALKALGGSAEAAGFYGAAQNLAVVPGLFSLSFSPLLLARLSKLLTAGEETEARALAGKALRLSVALLPFAGLTAGTATEIVTLVFGAPYHPAGPILALLIFAALGVAVISVSAAIVIAAGRPDYPFRLTGLMLAGVLAGHLLLIPRLGMEGAAIATTLVAVSGAVIAVIAVRQVWQIAPPLPTLARALAIGAVVYLLGSWWTTPGALVLVKLGALTLLIGGLYLLLGEVDRGSDTWRRRGASWPDGHLRICSIVHSSPRDAILRYLSWCHFGQG